jgi:glutaminyl-tRNA synthetase
VKGTIHWVSAQHALPCEVRLYDRLFTVPDPEADEAKSFLELLNPASLVVVENALIEPSVQHDEPATHYQFERVGFFIRDPDTAPDRLVFNRTVTLRDTWAKQTQAPGARSDGRPQRDRPHARSEGTERRALDELSADRRAAVHEFARVHQLDDVTAEILTREPATERLFMATVEEGASARLTANWIVNELAREVGDTPADTLAFDAPQFAALLRMIENEEINSSAARDVFATLVREGGDPAAIVDARGLRQVSDVGALERIVDDVIAANPDKLAAYRNGRTGLLGFFVGQVMSRSGGKANPQVVQSILAEKLQTQ